MNNMMGILLTLFFFAPLEAKTPDILSNLRIYGTLLEYQTDKVEISKSVASKDVIISIPVKYYQTAVLKEAVFFTKKGKKKKQYIAAGSHGFRVGFYNKKKQRFFGKPMWCFTEDHTSAKSDIKCLRSRDEWEAIDNLVDKYAPFIFRTPRKIPTTTAPQIEEKRVSIHPDLRVECIFLKWKQDDANIRCLLGGGHAMGATKGISRGLARANDGSALLNTPVGLFKLSPDPKNPKIAIVEQIEVIEE